MSSQNLISRNGGWIPFHHSTARKKKKTTSKTDKQTKQLQFCAFTGSGIPSQPVILGIPRVSLTPPPRPPRVPITHFHW